MKLKLVQALNIEDLSASYQTYKYSWCKFTHEFCV